MLIALLLAFVSVLASLTYLVLFFVLHFLPTGYSPLSHAVSDYGVGKYAALFRVALWASALGILALALGLCTGVGSPPLALRDLMYLGLPALTRVAMVFFPTDIEGERLTRTGILHYVFAILTFAFTYMAISNLTPVLQTLQPWQAIKEPLTVLAWIMLPALVLVIVTLLRPLRRIFGLFERIFLLTANVWTILVGLLLVVKML